MRITSTTLRRIIKEELEAVMYEDRAEHVAGIEAKIKRLEAEVERAQERRDEIGYDPAADDPRTSKTYRELGVRIENMEDKLEVLRQQRAELSAMEEGRASETPAERKERIAAEKEAKKKVDRARGSYYRHQPPDRPETYPGEFAARYMQEDAAMNEEDENVDYDGIHQDLANKSIENIVATIARMPPGIQVTYIIDFSDMSAGRPTGSGAEKFYRDTKDLKRFAKLVMARLKEAGVPM